jgi:hypothetical protein
MVWGGGGGAVVLLFVENVSLDCEIESIECSERRHCM